MKMLNIYKILIAGGLLWGSLPVYASTVNITETLQGVADGSRNKQEFHSTYYQTYISNDDVLGDVLFNFKFYSLDADDDDEYATVFLDGYDIFTTGGNIPQAINASQGETLSVDEEFTISELLFEDMISDGILNWEIKTIDVGDWGQEGFTNPTDERLELEISYEISDQQPSIIPTYDVSTQVLSIPTIGILSNAYQLEMELFSTDPTIGFVLSGFTDLGKIADDEDIAVIYDADNNSILLPTVIILSADGSEVELNNINLAVTIEANDIYFWVYEPEEE